MPRNPESQPTVSVDRLLAEKEERAVRALMSEVISTQMQKVQLKLNGHDRFAEREGKKAKVHMEDLGFSAFADNVDVAPLRDFYGLVDFPWHLLVCRSDSNDASKKVLLVSPAAKRLVLRAKDHKLRVVHAGVVALQRTSASARGVVDYRLSQDGIDLVLPFMTKRKVKCSAADFALLTDGGAKRIADLSVAAEVDALDAGGLAFYLDGDEPPADEPNGAAKKAKLGEPDASQS